MCFVHGVRLEQGCLASPSLFGEMEEWRWKDEMMKAHVEHSEWMDQ